MESLDITVLNYLDAFFISFYRFIPDPVIAFFLGTFILSFICVVVGEFSISLAFIVNRKYVDNLNIELTRWNNLSIEAIEAGDKESYKACNQQANDVYGKLFFMSLTYAAASLWPAAFGLAWMQSRFSEIFLPIPFELPGIGNTLGYPFVFIVLFIISKMLFSYIKPHIPYFRRIKAMLDSGSNEKQRMRSFAELFEDAKSEKAN